MDWPKKIIDDEYVQISILSFLHYIAFFFFEYLTVGLLEFLFVPKLKLTGLSTGICHTFFVVAYVYFLVWDCSLLFDNE